jgi:DNA-binding LytR/AlgR family response regulator
MESYITFLSIDDDEMDLIAINRLASFHPLLKHKGSFSNASDGLDAILAINPGLIFLDIDMPGISGLEMAKKIKDKVPMVVFVTSHLEFALDGFQLSALDYLLKPVSEARFAQTIQRIGEYWQMMQKAAAYEILVEKESLLIKEGHNYIRLPQQEVIYLEAMQDYSKVVALQKKYMVNLNLSGFMERLPVDKFLRIHRSYAVSVQKIKQLRLGEVMGDGFVLPVGKTYRAVLAQIKLK